jgi:hypothetical protein
MKITRQADIKLTRNQNKNVRLVETPVANNNLQEKYQENVRKYNS